MKRQADIPPVAIQSHPLLLLALIVAALGVVLGSAGVVRAESGTMGGDGVEVLSVSGKRVVQASYGDTRSAAVTSDGSVYVWGGCFYNTLGYDTTPKKTVDGTVWYWEGTPRRVPGIEGAVQVAVGNESFHDELTAAITRDGSVYTWGSDENGGLGHAGEYVVPKRFSTNSGSVSYDINCQPSPKLVDGVSGAVDVSVGGGHCAVVTSDGSLYTWGDNYSGQLGDGTTQSRMEPRRVAGLSNVVDVSLFGDVSAAVTADGSVYTWGYRVCGGGPALTPQRVAGIPRAISVSCGVDSAGDYYAVVTSDGELYTWGSNLWGQIGDGNWGFTNPSGSESQVRTSPYRVEGLPRVVASSCGDGHIAALASDGGVYLWGSDGNGQLGDDSPSIDPSTGLASRRWRPERVSDLPEAAQVSLGQGRTAVVTSDGALYACGGNSCGRLGGGSEVFRRTFVLIFQAPLREPVPVSPDPDVSYVYRLYNRSNGEHLYTVDANEANTLQSIGWKYEGVGWNAPKTSSKPIYRLNNPYTGEHLYTTDANEYRTLSGMGWIGEGEKIYCADSTGVPTYRLMNPWGSGPTAHHYTTDANERATLLKGGYRDEGICWYGLN